MKIAILYSGLIRTLAETISNNLDYFRTTDIDLYFSIWDCVGYTNQINAPDNIMSKRVLDKDTVITERVIRDLVPININIKEVKIEKQGYTNHSFNLVNGLDRSGLASQYYRVRDCYQLLDNQTDYDAIVKLRCDIVLRNQINLDYLFREVADNKIVFASKIWYDFTWKPSIAEINDMLWISNRSLMQKSCNIYNNTDKINSIISTKKYTHPNFGESICFMNLEAENMTDNIVTFDFDYQILR